MHSRFWVRDSDEILAPARAGMRIAPSRSGAIEPSYRSWRGGMYLNQGFGPRCPRIKNLSCRDLRQSNVLCFFVLFVIIHYKVMLHLFHVYSLAGNF